MRHFLLVTVTCALALVASPRVHATTVSPPEFSELVNGADFVVRARVVGISHELRRNGAKTLPYTKVELEVKEVISGTPPSPLVLLILGGPVDGDELVIAGAPRFVVGDEDILFVADNGRSIYPLYGMMHGRYPILREAGTGREIIARSNHQPLGDTAEVSLPLADGATAALARRVAGGGHGLGPTEFVNRIRAARKPAAGK